MTSIALIALVYWYTDMHGYGAHGRQVVLAPMAQTPSGKDRTRSRGGTTGNT